MSAPLERQHIFADPSAATGHGRLQTLHDPLLPGLLLVQAALSLWAMWGRTLWLDEAYSAILARRSSEGIRAALRHDSGPPLYYELLRLWRWAFGESPLALRSLSLLFALGSTVLLYRLALRRFDRATARTATALFAVLPIGVFYAGQARNYALLAFLALLLLTLLTEPELRRSLRFGLVAIVLVTTVYNHNVGWFVAAAALGAAALAYPRRVLDPWLAVPAVAVVLAFVPWYPILRAQAGNISWVAQVWSPWSPLQGLAGAAPFGYVSPVLDLPRAPGAWWFACSALWIAPIAWAGVELLRRRRADLGALLVFVVLGLGLPALASALLQPMAVPGRHDFFVVPVAALLVAVGLRSAPSALRSACLAVLLALGVGASVAYARAEPARDERAWTQAIAERARSGDVVLCTGFTRPAAEYYLAGRGLRFASYPEQMAEDLAHFDEDVYLATVDLAAEARRAVTQAAAGLEPGGRLWVVASARRIDQLLFQALLAEPDLDPEPAIASPRSGLRILGEEIRVLPLLRTRVP